MHLSSAVNQQVHGIIRRSSSFNTGRIDHLYHDRHETGVKLFLHYGDLCDATNLISIISSVKPDEIYNLGAMSHVKVSFETPEVSLSSYISLMADVLCFRAPILFSTLLIVMGWVFFVCLMPFERVVWKRNVVSIKHRPVSFMGK